MVTARQEPPRRCVKCAPRFWCLVGASAQHTAADHYDRANGRGPLQLASQAADERVWAEPARALRSAVGPKMFTRTDTSAIHTKLCKPDAQAHAEARRSGGAAAAGGRKSRQLEPANL